MKPIFSRYMVALLGARMHYAVPRILFRAAMLAHLFTDLDSRSAGVRWLRHMPSALTPAALRRLLGRQVAGIPPEKTTAFSGLGLAYAVWRALARSPSDLTRTFLWANREFCRRVCDKDWPEAQAVFTFNGAGLEILQQARARGLRTVMEQTIAPAALEQRLLQEEQTLHPRWESATEDRYAAEYRQREQAEWPLADLIVCGSEFVRDAIRQCGGPDEKCIVVPYGVDLVAAPPRIAKRTPVRQGPLRVLTVGTVGLRKGSPYVFEAARRLQGKAIFRMVGPSSILPQAEDELSSVVEYVGAVPRSETVRHYAWAEVFLLPSLCEGSATAIYEALASGLPVVCTPNAGSVIRDEVEGFLVPLRDVSAMTARLLELHRDRLLLSGMSAQALARAGEFTLDRYADRLLSALSEETQTRAYTCPSL